MSTNPTEHPGPFRDDDGHVGWEELAAKARESAAKASVEDRRVRFERLIRRDLRSWELSTADGEAALRRWAEDDGAGTCARWREFGERNDFLIAGGLFDETDPPPTGVDADVWASWGEIHLVIRGKSVTRHARGSRQSERVRWLLLPLIEWMVASWDLLFSIEAALPEPDSDEWYRWRSAHAPRYGARLGGPWPDLMLRRWVHRVELTWRPVAFVEPPISFTTGAGTAHVATPKVTRPLRDWAAALVEDLRERADSERLEKLHRKLKRLPLFEGGGEFKAVEDAPLQPAVEAVLADQSVQLEERLQRVSAGQPTPLRLLFGSVAPTVTETDVRTLLEAANEHASTKHPPNARLRRAWSYEPLRPATPPYAQGQQLAIRALSVLGVDQVQSDWIDVETILNDLGVPVCDVELEDPSIRAVAIGVPGQTALVLVNLGDPHNDSYEARRFTLAHELCHVLFDQGLARPLGVADGPWAPEGVEARANAFAAMFLMPPLLVRKAQEGASSGSWPKTVKYVARQLRTSYSATDEHLKNLRGRFL